LRFASGVEVRGRLEKLICDSDGRPLLISLSDCRVWQAGDLLFDPAWGVYDMAVAESVAGAFAGSADPAFWSPPEFSQIRQPGRTLRLGKEATLLGLYHEALALWEHPDAPELVECFESLADALRSDFPKRWLLRWNLLECLAKTGRGAALADRLRSELLAIEDERPDDLPISMGLRFLDEEYPR
jgi:phenylalanine-4-hydroxylase